MANDLLGLNGALYNRLGSVGVNDPALDDVTKTQANVYDESIRLGNVIAGSTIWVDGPLVQLIRGDDSSTADLTLTTSWQRVANAEAVLRGEIATGSLNVMGSGWLTGSGSVEWGLSADAGTQPVNFFQQSVIPAAFDNVAAFGGTHPDEVPVGSPKVFLWIKASSGSLILKGSTGQPTHWGVGVRAPDSALHGWLSTYGNYIVWSDVAGVEHGVSFVADGTGIVSVGDMVTARTLDGAYDPSYGGYVIHLSGLEVHGQTFEVLSSAFKLSGLIRPAGGGAMLVDAQGTVYIREESTSKSQTDTSNSTQAVTLTPDLITGLNMTLTDAYTVGAARAYLSVSFDNADTRTGDFFVAVRVNTVEGSGQTFPVDAIGTGALTVDLPIPETLAIGDVIDVVCWRTDDVNALTLTLNGVNNTHTISVYEQAEGGGGTGEANTLGDVGSGIGISAGKAGTVLQAKSFVSGDATVNITSTGTEVDFRAVTGGGGDMSQSVYDAGGIAADCFARANATGTQAMATISDAGTSATLNVPAAGDAAVGEVVKGSDTRLTDARTPTAHTHPLADITDSGSMAAVDDAVSDGNQYTRKDGAWSIADASAAVWGAITGTLSNQADLQSALDGKETSGAAASVQANLDTHKTSADHDGRYYTEAEVDALLAAKGQVDSVVGGTDITVDATDPTAPIVNYTGSGGGGSVTNPFAEHAAANGTLSMRLSEAAVGRQDPTAEILPAASSTITIEPTAADLTAMANDTSATSTFVVDTDGVTPTSITFDDTAWMLDATRWGDNGAPTFPIDVHRTINITMRKNAAGTLKCLSARWS